MRKSQMMLGAFLAFTISTQGIISEAQASPFIDIVPLPISLKNYVYNDLSVPYTELQLSVRNVMYLSTVDEYSHEFTVRLDGAVFDKAGDNYTEDDFKKLVLTKWLDPNMTVEITDFKKDEFTFVLKDALLRNNDIITIALNSKLTSYSSSAYGSVSIESDFINIDPISYTSVTDKVFSAEIDSLNKIVAGESVALSSSGIKITPSTNGVYQQGTSFELGISSGFEFSSKGIVKVVDSGNSVTTGKIQNGKIYFDAPSSKPFTIQGIVITADNNVKVGDIAEVTVYSQGMSAKVNSAGKSVEASEGDRPPSVTSNSSSSSSNNNSSSSSSSNSSNSSSSSSSSNNTSSNNNTDSNSNSSTVVTPSTDSNTSEDNKDSEDTSKEDVLFPYKVEIPVGANAIYVDNKAVSLDVPAYIHSSGYTMLPIRAIAGILGDNAIIDWDNDNRTVIIEIPTWNREILITVGSPFYTINGANVPIIGVPMEIKNDRAFVSIRPLANALGITEIDWNNETKVATLN